MAELDPSAATTSSIFSQKSQRPPDDTVFFSIFPDFALHSSTSSAATTSELQALHLQILQTLAPYTSNYIWQHEPFNLSLSSTAPPHLSGKLRFGDNLEDEWFVVFLLYEISRNFPNLSIRVWDSDGEFLLIEAAFHLPRWLNPDTATNRVFIRCGRLHIIPKSIFHDTPSLRDALRLLIDGAEEKTKAPEPVQLQLENRLKEYPLRAENNVQRVRVRVPVSVAQVLKHEPCLISLAVEGFYDRDIDTMKFAAKMERFLRNGSREELVPVAVRMSRAMYAQLVQQAFQAPKCYPPLPPRSDVGAYLEAELGLKIACGLEMIYQLRKMQGMEGKGSTWEAFKKSLEKSGYFEGLLPGSNEYKRLMQNAEEYYRNSSLQARTSEMLNAPVRRIDEILALPHSVDDFKNLELPPSDDDSWLYGGEDELNAALHERQKEMEDYNSKHKKKQNSKEEQADSDNLNDYDLKNISKSMQAFVKQMSSYQGAEVPESSMRDVDFDVDRFMEDINSLARQKDSEDTGSEFDIEGSNSDMEFDESDDESDGEDNEVGGDPFMQSYAHVLNEELKGTSLSKSFARADEQPPKKDEGTSAGAEGMEEELAPVDVDFNLVKSLLDSFSSQQGNAGPASNLLGLLGLNLPQDANSKGK
ncbi:protein ecdysoneless homolog [Ipomoea triloba]|uniref:protein ecdysoneless homolog n=1 Tax=Ipomoea triloba TaxID=35885 RepID=UPI00125CD756|nr:protein ecdysoneless homolog [Ipomoea triloba]